MIGYLIGGAAALVGLYELNKHPGAPAKPSVGPATPTKPPSPPPVPPVPNPIGPGVLPQAPPAYPGFVGLSVAQIDDLSPGTPVTAIWANSPQGAAPMTGDATHDDPIGAQQAMVSGTVQSGSSAAAVHVKIDGVLDTGNAFPIPANLAAGSVVTAPANVWIPAQGLPGGGSTTALTAGGTATVNTASLGPTGSLNLRANPSTNAQIIGSLAHGDVVTIVSVPSSSWAKVTTSSDQTGYASTAFLQAN